MLQTVILLILTVITSALTRMAVDAGIGGWTPVVADMLYACVSLVASWAVIFRRLHDFGVHGREVLLPLLCVGAVMGVVAWRTGWEPSATLWIVTNLIGNIPLIAVPGAARANAFGPSSGRPTIGAQAD